VKGYLGRTIASEAKSGKYLTLDLAKVKPAIVTHEFYNGVKLLIYEVSFV